MITIRKARTFKNDFDVRQATIREIERQLKDKKENELKEITNSDEYKKLSEQLSNIRQTKEYTDLKDSINALRKQAKELAENHNLSISIEDEWGDTHDTFSTMLNDLYYKTYHKIRQERDKLTEPVTDKYRFLNTWRFTEEIEDKLLLSEHKDASKAVESIVKAYVA